MGERLCSPVRWFGGKGNRLAKILPLIPYGDDVRVYVEPYCGGASLFFAKRPHPIEVLNDLDRRVVALFRALQDPDEFAKLAHRLRHTPYARAEFARAIEILESGTAPAADQAWALFVVTNQGMGGRADGLTAGSWGRAVTAVSRHVSDVNNKWLMRLSMLEDWHKRLLLAQIDCRDALEVIRYWDSHETVFYLDPPYIPNTRVNRQVYAHEADAEHHQRLVEVLLNLRGMAALSGYAHPIYAPLEAAGWERLDYETSVYAAGRIRGSRLRGPGSASAAVPRVESAWLSPRLAERLRRGGA